MSWQKCTKYFSKCSCLEVKKVIHLKLSIKEIKGRTIISDKQNFKNKAGFYASEIKDGFYGSEMKIKEKFKLKAKLTKTKI